MAVCSGGRFCLSAPGCSCWRQKQRFGVGRDGYGRCSWKPPGGFLTGLAGPGPSHGGPRASSSLLSCGNQEERHSALGWGRRDRNAAGLLSGLQSGDVLPRTHPALCDAQGPSCPGPSAPRVPTSRGKGGQEEAQPRSAGKPAQQVWGSGPADAAPPGPLQEPAHTYCSRDVPGSCGLFCHPSGAVCPAGLWHLSFPFSLSPSCRSYSRLTM